MSPTSAALLAMTLSFAVMVAAATWYVAPWLKVTDWGTGLTALLWVNAFRYVALQIFSAQQFGFAVSDAGRNQIAYGDVIAALLAVAPSSLYGIETGWQSPSCGCSLQRPRWTSRIR